MTLNPIWNEVLEEDIRIPRNSNIPIKIIVKDKDVIVSDDLMGYCDIDWYECAKKPGTWAVNSVFGLDGTPDMK